MEIESLIQAQKQLAGAIERLLINFGKDGPSRKTPEYLTVRREDLVKLWKDFNDNHTKLKASIKDEHPYLQDELYEKTQSIYTKALATIENYEQKKAMNALGTTSTSTNDTMASSLPTSFQAKAPFTTSTVPAFSMTTPASSYLEDNRLNNFPKLPPIKIPKFSGDYKEWKPFIDIFTNVIHLNSYLSNVEKMQYLLYHLEGDARKVISHLQLSNDNYDTALHLIKARFNNDRRIITTYINTIMDARRVEYRSQEDIIMLYDTIRECLEALKALNCQTDSWGPMIVCIAIRKLDPESLRLFEESLSNPREMPSTAELLHFLEKRYQVLDCIRSSKQIKADAPNINKKKAFHATTKRLCVLCNKDHNIYHCIEFKKMNVEDRIAYAAQKRICTNCLAHTKEERCKTSKTCFYCNKKHHTLLHKNNETDGKSSNHKRVAPNEVNKNPKVPNQIDPRNLDVVTLNSRSRVPNVLLPTAMVRIRNGLGQTELYRALIDPGSQVSLITEEAVQNLKLQKERIRTTILGVGETKSTKAYSKVGVQIQLQGIKASFLWAEALVLPKLSSMLPDTPIRELDMTKYNNIILADPTFDRPGPIDLLLGADVYANILLDGLKPGPPAAQNTKLGWIIFGNIPNTSQKTNKVSSFVSLVEIDEKLQRFWEMDEDTVTSSATTDACEEHFKATCERNKNGQYTVRLPFKENPAQLGHSRNTAVARLLQVEKRLSRCPDDMAEYNRFLAEYEALGHMSPATKYRGDERKVYYLPHHAVFKRDSTTTKLRVVFDASCKTSSGVSLNDLLNTGEKIQQDLRQILLRWRKHRYVFTADIEKMFRQIKVSHKDRNYLRILWRQHPSEPIQEFILNTVTYGTAPATYLAVRTLKQLAEDDGRHFPIAKQVLVSDFYIDDMLSGADTKSEALELQTQIIALLKNGGFNLRKWTSNNDDLLKNIPEDMVEKGILEIAEEETIKTLGIHWNPLLDEFQFKIKCEDGNSNITKRTMAAKIASLFDPLGLLAPITITAKLIMQSLWKEKTDWDQTPSTEIINAWHKLEKEMPILQEIRIPRWISYRKHQEIQLHGFCDASERAHAAVVYARTTDSFGKVAITLLTARTKVTPLKQKVTIPKLELCGALLLARLLKSTIDTLKVNSAKVFAWCDSEIVLAWLSKNPNEMDPYRKNRVSEIQKLFDIGIWRHVSSAQNPADVASRGLSPNKLASHNLWWRGPLWLAQSSEAWPIKRFEPEVHQEQKGTVMVLKTVSSQDIFTCSTYTKQVRVIAYCLRFLHNCKKPRAMRSLDHLSSKELQEAKNYIIKLVQLEEFADEINTIKKNIPLKKTSKLIKLRPFLDPEGILRVGGRIQNSNLSMEAKHQILLPSKHHIANLIIDHAHQQTLHGGTQQTLNYIRNAYWIIDGKRRVQGRNLKCIKCLRHRKENTQPLMGNLPTVRVTPSPPFSNCGVDYAGPFLTKRSKGRGTTSIKGYISVFVCMVTKAIHLELVTDLSTDAFLAAYKRFVARRGIPKQIFSDNGTNFVGARNKLHKDLRLAIDNSTKQTAELTANDGTEWKFIPPASPHFGGLWEAAVKSVKHHLKRILGETLLTYEEFSTVLYQVEACLNSRPIGQQSSDPTDLEPLTPGHFLIGRPLIAPPEPDIADENVYQRWKFVTKLYQNIWKRWSEEYLTLLQQRSKWTTDGKNPSVGELVLVKEDNLAPQKWPLGRIVQLHPGEDGIVRVVSVQYKNGVKKRPLIKICQLPLNIYHSQDEDDNRNFKATTSMITIRRKAKSNHSKYIYPEPELWSKPDHFDQISTMKTIKRKPVSTLSPPVKKRKRILPCTWASRLIFSTLSVLYWLTIAFAQDYEIFHPKCGFYVENLGHAQIKRGNLRLQLTFPTEQIIEDQKRVDITWTQIKQMCERTKKLTEITHCTVLFQHLSTRRGQLLKDIEEILQLAKLKNRSKRGVLGSLLTSIFGVNDEVYNDIEVLQHNQQSLLYSTNQQMLMLNTKINQSNFATMERLKQLDKRVAQVVSTINEMSTWFTSADHNRISIEVISAYLSAEDYYDELQQKYSNLLNAAHNHGHLLNFISMHDIKAVVQNISSNIGPDLIISTLPQSQLEVRTENNTIRVYGYLNIVERQLYDLIHVTPIPHMIEANKVTIADAIFSTFAINFNQQTYFTLEQQELKSCSNIGNHIYLCTPNIIHNIQDSPSCVIDEIYDRYPKTNCEMHQLSLTGTIWKALMMKNTWLYITNETKVVGVLCRGARTDLLLNDTGIIHLHEDCHIKTKEITLKTALDQSVDVISSHIKEVAPSSITLGNEIFADAK